MHVVFLVGAGATLAAALPSRPSRGRTPPLDRTFLELCRIARFDGRATIRRYMVENYGIEPFSGSYRMEEVFNYLYSDVFTDPPPPGALDAYWLLMRMYASAIARTTNWIPSASRSGISGLLRRVWLADRPSKVTFITFNQDLLIEKALNAAAQTNRYGSIPWDILRCYPMRFRGFLHSANEVSLSHRGDPSVSVLKLHGSLNWFYRARSAQDAKNSIRKPAPGLYCLTNQRVLSDLRYREKTRLLHLLPLVVPPIYEKGPQYRQLLRTIWRRAGEAIERADRLVVFGYSFPDADFAARSLLRRSFHRNSLAREVTVIDTSPAIAGRISALLGATNLHYVKDVESFT